MLTHCELGFELKRLRGRPSFSSFTLMIISIIRGGGVQMVHQYPFFLLISLRGGVGVREI